MVMLAPMLAANLLLLLLLQAVAEYLPFAATLVLQTCEHDAQEAQNIAVISLSAYSASDKIVQTGHNNNNNKDNNNAVKKMHSLGAFFLVHRCRISCDKNYRAHNIRRDSKMRERAYCLE